MVIEEFQSAGVIVLIVIAVLWELYWKGMGLWKAARNSQIYWFIAIFLLNTMGLLPILYLVRFQPKSQLLKRPKRELK